MLSNRNAIITGASRGLGAEIAGVFVQNGANVLLCARDAVSLEKERGIIEGKKVFPEQRILSVAADLSRPEENDRIVAFGERELGRIDILVNNAAVQGPIGPMEENPWDAWEKTIQTDLLGPAYLMHSLIPIMKKQGRGKIINLSGGGATGPRENYSAYAVAKTGLVRLTETLARETKDDHIDINAVAPGAMTGRMLEETLRAGEKAVGRDEYRKALERKEKGGASLENAARLCLFLASDQSDGITGKLISAVWDDWEHFSQERIEKMRSGDIYTLRRIIPQDRGENWDRISERQK